jgi:NAD(P)H-dependent FMN reductase
VLSPCRILAVSGSLQARSSNRVLLERAQSSAPPDVEVRLFDGLRALPPFDPDVSDEATPEPVRLWRAALTACDAVLLASPEYGFSLPGVLKNAIDWVIGSGQLEGKVVGITAAVKTAGRGNRGLQALAEPLRAVSARIVGGTSIVQGPSFERDVAELVGAVAREARQPTEPADHGMGRPRPSALALEWVDRRNRGDAQAMAQLYAKDATLDPEEAPLVKGREEIARALEGAKASWSPLEVEHLLEDGVTALLVWRGPDERRGCVEFTVRRWEIVSQREYPAKGPRGLG